MVVDPHDLRTHLTATLQQAVFGFGPDLLLALPSRAAPPASDAAAHGPSSPSPQAVTPPGGDRSHAGVVQAAVVEAAPALASVDAPRPPAAPAAVPEATAPDPLALLRTEALACRKCKLCESRKSVVFGEGHRQPDVMFVGEAPGATEDQTGRPFVGAAGELLTKILAGAMGLRRDEVYIANVNKCRPPGNRQPEPDEVAACLPFLGQQIALLRPKVLVALGRTAAHNLLDSDAPMRELRGRELSYAGIPLVVTWHPAYLLRDPSRKVETWADIKRVNRLLGRPEDPRRPSASEA